MNFCLVQSDIIPDSVESNLAHYEQLLRSLRSKPDVIVFPEMFACGFSPLLGRNAEPADGKSSLFLQDIAHRYQCDVIGSVSVSTRDTIRNRFLWMNRECITGYYDKRHLYFGIEKEVCSPGTEKVIIQKEGVKFLPLICYDVRFPVWSRNRYNHGDFLYDCIVIIANFPAQRAGTLRLLAQARAIENQAYVMVCNRIGRDGNHHAHSGNSVLINPLGKIVAEARPNKEELLSVSINLELLERIRRKFPIYEDWD